MIRSLLIALMLVASSAVYAADPSEMLPDPGQEARAQAIGRGLRCLVCQSESIEESNADLARDLRVIVRERVKAGDSDQAIRDYVVARYGDYVLLNPPFKISTVILWLGPFALLVLAVLLATSVFKRRSEPGDETRALTPEERRRLDQFSKGDEP